MYSFYCILTEGGIGLGPKTPPQGARSSSTAIHAVS